MRYFVRTRKPTNIYVCHSDSSSKEWGNHKYIDKIKTASGEIRYIYDDMNDKTKDTRGFGDLDTEKLGALKTRLSEEYKRGHLSDDDYRSHLKMLSEIQTRMENAQKSKAIMF